MKKLLTFGCSYTDDKYIELTSKYPQLIDLLKDNDGNMTKPFPFWPELLSKRLVKDNFGTFISAGGETSGAVINGLGIQELKIGKEISHGVPALWSPDSIGNKPVFVTLKSGNFGQDDFFERALKALTNS